VIVHSNLHPNTLIHIIVNVSNGIPTTATLGDELEVSRIGFGALRLTAALGWGSRSTGAGAVGVLPRAVELGVTLIDTARLLPPARQRGAGGRGAFTHTRRGSSSPRKAACTILGRPRRSGRRTAARSASGLPVRGLRQLRRDRIDVYQLHAVDPGLPIEESAGALAKLQAGVQNRYSLGDRASDTPAPLETLDLHTEAWAPARLRALEEPRRQARRGRPAKAEVRRGSARLQSARAAPLAARARRSTCGLRGRSSSRTTAAADQHPGAARQAPPLNVPTTSFSAGLNARKRCGRHATDLSSSFAAAGSSTRTSQSRTHAASSKPGARSQLPRVAARSTRSSSKA
jgi:hypothetical protein